MFTFVFCFFYRATSTQILSTILEEAPSATTLSDESPKKKIVGPTRFDRLKQLYKGVKPPTVEDDDNIPFTYSDFASAVSNTEYAFERNSIVTGVCVEYSNSGCLVDIGAKSSAFLPELEAGLIIPDNKDLSSIIPLDTEMEFQIISEEDENGQLLVSIKRIQYKKAWDAIRKLAEEDAVVETTVIAVNRGGAICIIEGLRAFLPGSHLAGQLPSEELVGVRLPVKFLEVNTETNKLVVSNRKAVVEQQMSDLSRGDLVVGVVKALKPYGAFVEVGGMSGLLHISQISYDRIEDLSKVLEPGMQVKCMIIDHDKVNGRIALSTKTLEPEPGDMLRKPQFVFDNADQTALIYHERMEKERQAREESARGIVLGLGDSLDDLGVTKDLDSDPLQDVSDSLDSLLA